MRTIIVALGVLAVTTVALAQAPAPAPAQAPAAAMQLFASSADVAALVAKAKTDRRADQPMLAQRVVALAPFTVNLEYRPGVGPASVHEKEAEFFVVVEGTATAVTGGKLVNERRTNADNLSGTAIEGGASKRVAKGDVLLVPAGVPHQFIDVNEYFQLSLHLPMPAK